MADKTECNQEKKCSIHGFIIDDLSERTSGIEKIVNNLNSKFLLMQKNLMDNKKTLNSLISQYEKGFSALKENINNDIKNIEKKVDTSLDGYMSRLEKIHSKRTIFELLAIGTSIAVVYVFQVLK